MNGKQSQNRSDFVKRAVKEHQRRLLLYATRLLGGDIERARDVVQDTFIRLVHADHGKVESGLKQWLYTVCRNRAIDVIRKEKRMRPFEEIKVEPRAQADPSAAAERKEALGEVMGYMKVLSPNQKEVVRLKFQSDMSYREISEVTGLSVSNVGFLMHTALKKLQGEIGNSGNGAAGKGGSHE